jgi:hypothetical protein
VQRVRKTLLWATRNPPSRERTRHRPGLTRHKTRDGKRVELSWYPWTAGDASDGSDGSDGSGNITDVTGVPVPTYPTDPKRMVAGQGSMDGSPSPSHPVPSSPPPPTALVREEPLTWKV